ncbi:MAG: VOC family protein [Spirochaetota bacterium]
MAERPTPRLPFLDAGIGQIAFVVEDVEAVVKKYHDVFGVGPWSFYTYGKPLVSRMTYRGKPADYEARIALSYFGPMRVELIQSIRGPSVYDEFIEKHGYGVQHFGLLVDNMEEALQQAEAAGYPMIMDGAGFGKNGDGHFAYIDTEDDFDVVYELIERPKERHPPEMVFPSQQ